MTTAMRLKVVTGLIGALMSVGTAAYACVCCIGGRVTGCRASTYGAQSCHYLAPMRGDVSGRGVWAVDVRRGGRTIRYESLGDSQTYYGVIRAGDSVQAWVGPEVSCIAVGSAAGDGC